MRRIRRLTPFQSAALILLLLMGFRYSRITSATGQHAAPRTVSVAFVLDGDTFETTDGERIRLLGIDAPEIAHHDQVAEPHGRKARQALIALLADQQITLRFGSESVDRYGRTLAWVYTADGQLVNRSLLLNGDAKLLDRYGLPLQLEPELRQAEASARVQNKGLWSTRQGQ